MISVISIIGFANAGKTTFLEKLIREMTQRHVRVFAVKHTHHSGLPSVDPTAPSKDTARLKQAGAIAAILIGSAWDRAQGGMENVDLDAIRRLAQDHAPDAELVFIEGMKSGPAPKIEVSRRICGEQLIGSPSQGLVAVVADYRPDVPVPVFGLEDVEAVADFILNRRSSSNQ